MIQTGILNPHVLDLIARVRHTNTLVISDWAFPFWPEIVTVDISLTHNIPTVLDVLDLAEGAVCSAVTKQAAALRKPPMTMPDLLDILHAQGLVQSVAKLKSLVQG